MYKKGGNIILEPAGIVVAACIASLTKSHFTNVMGDRAAERLCRATAI